MRVGCLAQIVNVIAPLVTNERGVLRQSIFHPYAWALKYARGRVVDLQVESDMYPISGDGLRADFARNDQVPFVDVAVTVDAARRASLRADAEPRSGRRAGADPGVAGADADARPRLRDADRPRPQGVEHVRGAGRGRAAPLDAPAAGPRMAFKLPPRSYTVAHLATN